MTATLDFLPAKLPSGWTEAQRGGDGASYVCTGGAHRELSVIVSAATEADGRRWLHVSCARPRFLPSWSDVREVKAIFIGDREAYMVLPPAARYVNIHPNCLHLWCCLDAGPDGAVLPDFTRGGGTI